MGKAFSKFFRQILPQAFKKVPRAFSRIGKNLRAGFKRIGDGFRNMGRGIKNAFQKFGNMVKNGVLKFGNMVKNGFLKFGRMFIKVFTKLGNVLKSVFSKFANAIVKFFRPLAQFFINIGLLAVSIGGFMIEFVRNPFLALFKLILMIWSLIWSIVWLVIYVVLSLGPAQLVGQVFGVLAGTLLCIWAMVLYILLSIVSFAFFTVLWILNIVLGGILTPMLRCENTPDSWYKRSGFERGNVYTRLFLCFTPCSKGWRRIFGGLCVNPTNSCPSFCPQQQIFGYVTDDALTRTFTTGMRPYVFDKFVPDLTFYGKDLDERRQSMLAAAKEKRRFLGKCIHGMRDYDFVTRHICANIHNLDGKDFNDETKSKLRTLCRQAFCEYDVKIEYNGEPVAAFRPGAAAGAQTGWCGALTEADGRPPPLDESVMREFLLCLMMIIIGLLACFLALTAQAYMEVPRAIDAE